MFTGFHDQGGGFTIGLSGDVGEFVSGHLVNALNIDVEGSQFDAEIGKLDKEATYAVYCRSGRRSQVAIDRMKDAGFTNLFNLNAGVQEWAEAGLPLVTD